MPIWKIALAILLLLLLAAGGFLGLRFHQANFLTAYFFVGLRATDDDRTPAPVARQLMTPRIFDRLRQDHLKFADTPEPPPADLARAPFPESQAGADLLRPFLKFGKSMEPKIKTLKELVKEMPILLKSVLAVAQPDDIAFAPQHPGYPDLDHAFLADTASFTIQLAAGAASLGRLDMAVLLAAYPAHLGVAASNRGYGFGNVATHANHLAALRYIRLSASTLLVLCQANLSPDTANAVLSVGGEIARLNPIERVLDIDRTLYLETLADLATAPDLQPRKETVGRAMKLVTGAYDEALGPLLEAIRAGDPEATTAALAAYEAVRTRWRQRAADEGIARAWRMVFAPEENLADRLVFLADIRPLLEADREVRALAGGLQAAALLTRLAAEKKFPTTAGFMENLAGRALPRSVFEPKKPVEVRFETGRVTVRDGGLLLFTRPWNAPKAP